MTELEKYQQAASAKVFIRECATEIVRRGNMDKKQETATEQILGTKELNPPKKTNS